MIIRYQNYVEKCMKKNIAIKKGGNVGHDPMYLCIYPRGAGDLNSGPQTPGRKDHHASEVDKPTLRA